MQTRKNSQEKLSKCVLFLLAVYVLLLLLLFGFASLLDLPALLVIFVMPIGLLCLGIYLKAYANHLQGTTTNPLHPGYWLNRDRSEINYKP